MPWNDNANSGDKPGGKKPNPWGDAPSGNSGGDENGPSPAGPRRRPSGGGGRGAPPPPDFNDLTRNLARRLERLFGGGGSGQGFKPGAFAVVGGVILLLWAASGIYVVGANEQGVVRTFGAFKTWTGPGVNYHLPFPIETVQKVDVTTLRQTEVGSRSNARIEEESLMLTGDENIVDLQFAVLWRVTDAPDFVFNLQDPEGAVKAVAESAMREVIGRNALQPILTTARGQIQTQVSDLMQRVLDSYGAGVSVQEVQIRGANPPPPVVDAFRDVQSANQDLEATVNRARGEAAQIRQAAIGDRAQAIREAEGEAAAFNQVYDQYRLAPAVTRDRLYIETMERVLQRSRRVIIDNDAASAPIILPPEAFRATTPQAAARPSTGGAQ